MGASDTPPHGTEQLGGAGGGPQGLGGPSVGDMDATAALGRDDLLPHAQQGATLEPGVKFALVPVPSRDMGQQARGGPLALRTPTKQPRGQQDAHWALLTYFSDAFSRSRCQEGHGRLASPSTPSLAFFFFFFQKTLQTGSLNDFVSLQM